MQANVGAAAHIPALEHIVIIGKGGLGLRVAPAVVLGAFLFGVTVWVQLPECPATPQDALVRNQSCYQQLAHASGRRPDNMNRLT
jgi:hypothetical protein